MYDQATEKPVLICTDNERRGVFAGILRKYDKDRRTVVLEDARMCVRWSEAMNGILGLAQMGPDPDCRITPSAPLMEVDGVTMVARLTDTAWESWKSEPWG